MLTNKVHSSVHMLRTTQIHILGNLTWVVHRQTHPPIHHLGNFEAHTKYVEENNSSNAIILPQNCVGTRYQDLGPEDILAFASTSVLSQDLQIPSNRRLICFLQLNCTVILWSTELLFRSRHATNWDCLIGATIC